MENFLPSMPGTPAPVDKEILTQIYEDPRRKNFFSCVRVPKSALSVLCRCHAMVEASTSGGWYLDVSLVRASGGVHRIIVTFLRWC